MSGHARASPPRAAQNGVIDIARNSQASHENECEARLAHSFTTSTLSGHVNVQLWDTRDPASQMTRHLMGLSNGVVVCYNPSALGSVDGLRSCLDHIRSSVRVAEHTGTAAATRHIPSRFVMVVATQVDLLGPTSLPSADAEVASRDAMRTLLYAATAQEPPGGLPHLPEDVRQKAWRAAFPDEARTAALRRGWAIAAAHGADHLDVSAADGRRSEEALARLVQGALERRALAAHVTAVRVSVAVASPAAEGQAICACSMSTRSRRPLAPACAIM